MLQGSTVTQSDYYTLSQLLNLDNHNGLGLVTESGSAAGHRISPQKAKMTRDTFKLRIDDVKLLPTNTRISLLDVVAAFGLAEERHWSQEARQDSSEQLLPGEVHGGENLQDQIGTQKRLLVSIQGGFLSRVF